MLPKVFISYSEADYERARTIVQEIAQDGSETWPRTRRRGCATRYTNGPVNDSNRRAV